ncbi:MAG: DUF342 domain-containing protein [Candidatus Delongbacteria bacterium]|nr:DUF342 domain-containing protein [Candidatus Delongbacteria bacterium]MBN2836769.1 DUF342 domain-containing protein [Candidatus Delongbacteria bacterium]
MSKFEYLLDDKGLKCEFLNPDRIDVEITTEEIIEDLKKKKVVTGLKISAIEEIVQGKHKLSSKVVVAEFIKPGIGKPGYVEYLIDDSERVVSKDKNDNIDFYETGLIKTVQEGVKIVKIIPPENGPEGMNIFGETIPGLPGEEFKVKKIVGVGTVIDNSGNFIIALKSGIYKKNPIGVVSVVDELVVGGNLDFNIGNIETTSAVIVKGDIQPGFSCKTSNSLKVEGTIEDAYIECGENLICKAGIISGTNHIIAKEEIRTKYIYERTVECKNLFVQGMINNSNIRSTGEIEATKISGGNTFAMKKITVNELGNEQFAQTNVELGINVKVLNRMEQNAKEVADFKNELESKKDVLDVKDKEYKKSSRKLNELIESKSGNSAFITKLTNETKIALEEINTLKNDITIIERRISHLKKEYAILASKVEDDFPELIVTGTVYPNTSIRIKLSGRFEVKNVMKNVKFIIDENSVIKTVKL